MIDVLSEQLLKSPVIILNALGAEVSRLMMWLLIAFAASFAFALGGT